MKLYLNRINQNVAFEIQNEAGKSIQIDGSETIGGEGLGMRPMEILASSLAACASIDVLLILKKKRINLTHFSVEIEGKRKNTVPAAFESLHLQFFIGKEDQSENVSKAVKLSIEKYCSVVACLDKEINISYEIINCEEIPHEKI